MSDHDPTGPPPDAMARRQALIDALYLYGCSLLPVNERALGGENVEVAADALADALIALLPRT